MPEKIDLGWDGNSTTVHPQAIVMPPNINRKAGSNSQILRHRVVKVACGTCTVASEAQNEPASGVWLANKSRRASSRGYLVMAQEAIPAAGKGGGTGKRLIGNGPCY